MQKRRGRPPLCEALQRGLNDRGHGNLTTVLLGLVQQSMRENLRPDAAHVARRLRELSGVSVSATWVRRACKGEEE